MKRFTLFLVCLVFPVALLGQGFQNSSCFKIGNKGDLGLLRTGANVLAVTSGCGSFTVTAGTLQVGSIGDATDSTKALTFSLSGATTGTATTFTFAQTAARTVTWPDATGTVALTATGLSTPVTLGTYNGTTSVGITDTNFKVLGGPIAIPAAAINTANKHVHIEASGVYTNAAASLLNADIALCTVSGCATGTVLAPAGCVVTSTNQANNLTNGQFTMVCDLDTATTGATGTVMAKARNCFNLGSATSVVLSCFGDTATAASNSVDLTVAEYIQVRFKFTTSNASNSATLHEVYAQLLN